MWKKFLLLAMTLSLTAVKDVKAYYVPEGPVLNLVVDKKLRGIGDDYFADNLDRVFYETDYIEFEIRVKNSGNQKLENIELTDKLPPKLQLVLFAGSLENNQIKWQIDKLEAGEEKVFLIKAKISGVDSSDFGQKQQMVNVAEARSGEVYDSDQSIYFVGAKTIPQTGDGLMLARTGAAVLIAGLGLGLRRKIRGY